MFGMFQAVASLLLFGTLSPLSQAAVKLHSSVLEVAPLPMIEEVHIAESFSASGAMVLDLQSGKEIFGLNPDTPRPVGSLAKLMTFDVITKNHRFSDVVTVPQSVRNVGGNIVGLWPGERYRVRDLLSMILISSANDAAHTLAIYHSDSIDAFASAMNKRARALGLSRTHFENPIGFDGLTQYSTPRDLAWLALYVWKDPFVRSQASQRLSTVRDVTGTRSIVLKNTNRLLFSHPSSFVGLKTGTTIGAGECLISLAEIEEHPYIFVILKSSDRYRDTLALYESLSQL